MSVTTDTAGADEQLRKRVGNQVNRRKWLILGTLAAVFAYFVYAWDAFEISELIEEVRPRNAVLLGTDAVMHKVHVLRSSRTGELEIAVEGERTATYSEPPEWVVLGDDRAGIDLGEGYRAEIEGPQVSLFAPGYGEITARATEDGVTAELPPGPLPDWAKVADYKVDLRPTIDRRVQITRSKIEVHRYFFGWENFWFPFRSELNAYSWGELASLAMSGERLNPEMPNWQYIFQTFWENPDWQHRRVFIALWETLLMAVLGTLTAALMALMLSMLAAANFSPSRVLRFFVRRLFDFLRGIDMLIWSLIFIRAFGLGPLTGALAIAFTDTGSLGKLFSEALENVEKNQIEGVRATGANSLQRYRFGIIPQILPVFLSQTIYFLESNTRSATVIGALGAGGIGLLLVETMNTQRDWENVAYLIVLTILLVIAMDSLSGYLRRRLIKGGDDPRLAPRAI
ncbi:phosphonate ABC transporter, permease protein PhnE [Dichotomicrobium thermohalophilum]|uniref:Phosphonate transport system permease protein n=1 Tax=Dichotomicrobium thermohalophilum TaxID=933063 RepID=A0A397QBM0_9HYPH|nr:phosphonate ABC transporter, permease protein PhnE [Dichotomicrobium thermohalophilum]RIA55621.1 phosphonate transport system permease protein [Dichotomicrobium thermohalophilum]